MNNIYSFYNSILNIQDEDQKETIQSIVLKEKESVLSQVDFLDGLCVYMALQIQNKLREKSITTYYIDLNELVHIDHVVLIAEYTYHGQIKRILIDPTFIQFVKDDQKKRIKLAWWPSEKLDKKIVNKLLSSGMIEIDSDLFNHYINAFTQEEQNIPLDEFLLNGKLRKIK